jgi:PilZ domain
MASEDNKRRSPRRQCTLPIEIRTEGSAYPIQCETMDVSPYGCYVALMSTLAKDTPVDLVLWMGNVALRTKGRVKTADANVGNGIEFIEMPDATRAELRAYLEKSDAPPSDSSLIIR